MEYLKHVGDREDNTGCSQGHGSLGARSSVLTTSRNLGGRVGASRGGGGGGGTGRGRGRGSGSSSVDGGRGSGDDGSGHNAAGGGGGGSHGGLGVRSRIPQVTLGDAGLGNEGSLGVLVEAALALGDGDTDGVADVQVEAVGSKLLVPLEEILEGDAELGSEGFAVRGAGYYD